MNQIHWYERFQKAIDEERGSRSSRWMQLATVAQDGKPKVRTVVFRGWHGKNTLYFLSDSRSEKADEISKTPDVEICSLLVNSLCQFRFRGKAQINQNEFAQKCWDSLTPEVKSLWFLPDPGKPLLKSDKGSKSIQNNYLMPHNFIVILVDLSLVELLEIKNFPHKRMVWKANQNWKLEYINP